MNRRMQVFGVLAVATFVFAPWGCGSSDDSTPARSDASATGGSTGSGACARMPSADGSIAITGSNTMGLGASPAKLVVAVVGNSRNVTWNGGFESRTVNGTTQCLASASLNILGPTFTAGKVIKVTAPTDVTITAAPPAVPMGAQASDYAAAFVHEWTAAEKAMPIFPTKVSYRATGGTITVKSISGKTVTLTLNVDFRKVEGSTVMGDVIAVTGDAAFDVF